MQDRRHGPPTFQRCGHRSLYNRSSVLPQNANVYRNNLVYIQGIVSSEILFRTISILPEVRAAMIVPRPANRKAVDPLRGVFCDLFRKPACHGWLHRFPTSLY